ncbi:MAG: outer membrane lipoprotein carrier protein LolA [Deltaproteobacteria bacterium]|nr:outer membrane lipoprotein carrier protein LolA [Deltaproteobacteria bacterium]
MPDRSRATAQSCGKGEAKNPKGILSLQFLRSAAVAGTLVLSLSFTVGAAGLPLDDLVSKIQERYENTESFEADFYQEVTLGAMKHKIREEGTVYFKKPKRMLWHYHRPKNKKMIVNPVKTWLYLPEDRVAYVQPADQHPSSALGLKFLTGRGDLPKDFDMMYTEPSPVDRQGNYLITLIPRDRRSGIAKIFLTVDGADFRIIQCRFTDPAGNTTLLRLKNFKINSKLPESLFSFTPPPGVDVVNVPFQNP